MQLKINAERIFALHKNRHENFSSGLLKLYMLSTCHYPPDLDNSNTYMDISLYYMCYMLMGNKHIGLSLIHMWQHSSSSSRIQTEMSIGFYGSTNCKNAILYVTCNAYIAITLTGHHNIPSTNSVQVDVSIVWIDIYIYIYIYIYIFRERERLVGVCSTCPIWLNIYP